MPWRVRLGILFGRQYIWLRVSGGLTFKLCRAYSISGRWYTRYLDTGQPERAIPPPDKKAYLYWMLTPESMIRHLTPFSTEGSFAHNEGLWMPITEEIRAHMVMVSD